MEQNPHSAIDNPNRKGPKLSILAWDPFEQNLIDRSALASASPGSDLNYACMKLFHLLNANNYVITKSFSIRSHSSSTVQSSGNSRARARFIAFSDFILAISNG